MKTFIHSALAMTITFCLALFSSTQSEDTKSTKQDKKVSANNEIRCGCCLPGKTISPLIAALDIDKDGVISEIEIKNAASSLTALDADGNGHLTTNEFHAESKSEKIKTTKVASDQRHQLQTGTSGARFLRTMMIKYDTNNNFVIEPSEMPSPMIAILHTIDKNGDGNVSAGELKSLIRSLQNKKGK